jgi:hypothetical protein
MPVLVAGGFAGLALALRPLLAGRSLLARRLSGAAQ